MRRTLDLAKEVLKDIYSGEAKNININTIQEKVAKHFNVPIADMKRKKRSKSVAFPRQIAMYLSRTLTNASLPEIGEDFGGRDHTTVLHACTKIKELKEKDPVFNKTLEELIGQLKG